MRFGKQFDFARGGVVTDKALKPSISGEEPMSQEPAGTSEAMSSSFCPGCLSTGAKLTTTFGPRLNLAQPWQHLSLTSVIDMWGRMTAPWTGRTAETGAVQMETGSD